MSKAQMIAMGFCFLFNVVILLVSRNLATSPKLAKVREDERLIAMARSIQDHRASLLTKYEYLTEIVNHQFDIFSIGSNDADTETADDKIEEAVSEIGGSPIVNSNIVVSDALEKEVEIDTDIEKLELAKTGMDTMEINKVDSTIAKLEEVKTEMESMDIMSSLFCEECPFVQGDLRTTCAARRDYLVRQYGKSKHTAEEAVIRVDPNCGGKFCPECNFDNNGLKTSCGKRKAFLMENYGNSEEIAEEAVIQTDPNCKKGASLTATK